MNGVGGGVRRLAAAGRRIQTGFVRSYALGFFLGAVGVLVWLGTQAVNKLLTLTTFLPLLGAADGARRWAAV